MCRDDERYRSCSHCKYKETCDRSYLECREHIAAEDNKRYREKVKLTLLPISILSITIIFIFWICYVAVHGQLDIMVVIVTLITLAAMACITFCLPKGEIKDGYC